MVKLNLNDINFRSNYLYYTYFNGSNTRSNSKYFEIRTSPLQIFENFEAFFF